MSLLLRYLSSAILARLADEGARVGLILLALERTSTASFGGILVAAFMLPHVLAAPLVSALADRTRHPRLVHASGPILFGTALALGEAVGWRGYMLTRLVDARLPRPVLLSGLIWATWHLPLVLSGQYAAGPYTVLSGVLFILVVNLSVGRNAFQSLLFSVALAVGLTPEFLPMITTVGIAAIVGR